MALEPLFFIQFSFSFYGKNHDHQGTKLLSEICCSLEKVLSVFRMY